MLEGLATYGLGFQVYGFGSWVVGFEFWVFGFSVWGFRVRVSYISLLLFDCVVRNISIFSEPQTYMLKPKSDECCIVSRFRVQELVARQIYLSKTASA